MHLSGATTAFDPALWADTLRHYGDATETSYELASKARYERLLSCKKAHQETKTKFQYAARDMVLSYGESALYLAILEGPDDGKIPL